MITDFLFSANHAGVQYSMPRGFTYSLMDNGSFAGTAVGGEKTTVVLTGWYLTRDNGANMYMTIGNRYINLTEGWQRGSLGVQYSQATAQDYVNRIIKANKDIIANNILCARFSHKLSADQKKTLYELQTRLQARNSALIEDGLVTVQQTSYPAGYGELESYLQNFMATGGVGIATWAVIVVAAVVIASLSTAAYFAYKAYAAEAEQDVKYSKELTRTLVSKLTEEEYQQLLQETKGIVTKARIKQSLSNYSGILSVVLIATGAYMLVNLLKQK